MPPPMMLGIILAMLLGFVGALLFGVGLVLTPSQPTSAASRRFMNVGQVLMAAAAILITAALGVGIGEQP